MQRESQVRYRISAGICRRNDKAKEAGFDKAIGRLFKDFAGRDPLKAIDHMGDVYRDSDEYAKAAELFEYAAATWSESEAAIECQTNAVKAYAQKGDEPNATAAFERLIIGFWSSESIGPAVEQIADKYRDLGRAEQGYEKYKYVFEHWPGAERALWARTGMVMSRIRAWNLDAAEAELGSLLGEFGSDAGLPSAVHEIVEEYRNTGAHEESRELFAWLLDNWAGGDETLLELQVGVALQSIKLGELDKAESGVANLIADHNENPKIAKALFQIGEEYFYAGEYRDAAALWEVVDNNYVTSDFPAKGETPYVIGTCYERLREFDKALEYYKRGLQEYPENKFACRSTYRIGLIYERGTNEPAKSLEWYAKVREKYSDWQYRYRALWRLGTVYLYRLADYEKAVECWEEFIETYSSVPRIWAALYNLALGYEGLGDTDKAVGLLQMLVELTPRQDWRAKAIDKMYQIGEGGTQ